MTRRRVVAVWTAPAWREAAGLAFLRILAALTALGHEVQLLESEVARGVLEGDDLSDEAERYVAALARSGVRAAAVNDATLADVLADAESVVRVAGEGRKGTPPVLEVGHRANDLDPVAFTEAGQVVGSA